MIRWNDSTARTIKETASPTSIVFMPKPVEATTYPDSLADGSLGNSESNLQPNSGYSIGPCNFYLLC